MIEMTIDEYLSVARQIVDKNEFQRKRVNRSKTVYSLLRDDLQRGCTIPPIVLAFTGGRVAEFAKKHNLEEFDSLRNDEILELYNQDNLVILDGLQRTLSLMDVDDSFTDDGKRQAFLRNSIRVEIYLGIDRIGILYRMLTLNTGQTQMSLRHQIEILYSDCYAREIDGIQIFRQTDQESITRIGQYQFDDIVEGFISYLNESPHQIDRISLLDDISNLENLSKENHDNEDIFIGLMKIYNVFVNRIDSLTEHWQYPEAKDCESGEPLFNNNNDNLEYYRIKNPYGKNLPQIFAKSQTITGFYAAVGYIIKNEAITDVNSLNDFSGIIDRIDLGRTIDETMLLYLGINDMLKEEKKIGIAQRQFHFRFFRALLNPRSDQFCNLYKSLNAGFESYRANK